MASKYVDSTAVLQVIGCLIVQPELFEIEDKYIITPEDFVEKFHKIVVGAVYNLYHHGAKSITIEGINDYLETRPEHKAVFNLNKGAEYIMRVRQSAILPSFDYYYGRLKKMSLLRAYDNIGLDISDLYDPDNILDLKKRQKQEEWLDSVELSTIAEKVEEKIEEVKAFYVNNDVYSKSVKAGTGIDELIEELEQHPDIGVPLYGNYINTVTRGARLGKFYLRSAPSGWGKTRTMIADACNIACKKIYYDGIGWVDNGDELPVLFIGTEQDLSEIQTMMLSFLSNVNEEHVLYGKYENDEKQRVLEAAQLIKEAPLWVEELPEFNLQDVENVIKRNIRENNISYVAFDYIHTSLKILEEINKAAGKIALREDNVLFMLSARLKEICVKYGIFLISSTQLSNDWRNADTPDQNLLRGAKAIADKVDTAWHLLPINETDLKSLENIVTLNPVWNEIDTKLCFYKNRRGRFKNVILWCKSCLGSCRIEPMFMTSYNYELQDIDNIKILVKESAFQE